MSMLFRKIEDFTKNEASGGIVLMAVAVLAMIAGNSFLSPYYNGFLDTNIRVGVGAFEISKPAVLWINDGLMAIFFFLVGLEIKREVLAGELSSLDKAALPVIAAIGGMAIPGLVFAYLNWGSPDTMSGWAIPMATDIAFALGILALFAGRAPTALKVFLLAIAIIDDLGAIMIIAVFYSSDLSVNALTLSMLGFALAVGLNRMGVNRMSPYLIIGIFMWVCVLKSGVHATLAGVLIALAIPLRASEPKASLAYRAEHGLHPWVAFLVLPIFAFANAGVSLEGVTLGDLTAPLTLGIAAGLFVGKQVGVFGFTWLAVKMGIAKLPTGVRWIHVYAVAALTGVGFTMSLFIGSLAFQSPDAMNAVRLGVMLGSVASGILGFVLLSIACKEPKLSGQPVTQ